MRKILFASIITSLFASCQVENINYTTPVVVTYEPQNVLTTSASLGGYVLNEGGLDNTEYGIVYSTAAVPTVADNKILIGEGIGEFYYNFEEFEPGTSYNYRVYATNAIGTGYGETYSFTTSEEAPCHPVQENFVDTGGTNSMHITDVELELQPFFDGNLEFITSASNTSTRIYLNFNEINRRLPLTGTYEVVSGFDSQEPMSEGKVMVNVYNVGNGGGTGIIGTKVYVENNNGEVTFIFCDLETTSNLYRLNGKFTYSE